MTDILIYGAGGFAREVAMLCREIATGHVRGRVVGFIDDSGSTAELDGLAVFSLDEALRAAPRASIALAIGNSIARLAAAERAEKAGFTLGSFVSPTSPLDPSVRHGDGLVMCRMNTVTVDVSLGRAVQVNLHCTIGHDSVLEDGVTLAPGVHISGNVLVERAAYIGTGAVVINGIPGRPLRIGAGAIVGAGAVVIRDVAAGETVVGNPAKPKGESRSRSSGSG